MPSSRVRKRQLTTTRMDEGQFESSATRSVHRARGFRVAGGGAGEVFAVKGGETANPAGRYSFGCTAGSYSTKTPLARHFCQALSNSVTDCFHRSAAGDSASTRSRFAASDLVSTKVDVAQN